MSPDETRSLARRLLRPIGAYFDNPLHGGGLFAAVVLVFAATATAQAPFGEWFNIPSLGWTGVGVFAATVVNQVAWSLRHRRQLTMAERQRMIDVRRIELARLESALEAETSAQLDALTSPSAERA